MSVPVGKRNKSSIQYVYDAFLINKEIDKYIITHSFIPVFIKNQQKYTNVDEIKHLSKEEFQYNPDGRNEKNTLIGNSVGGFDAGEKYEGGLFDEEEKKGKILIAGHGGNPDLYRRHVCRDGVIHSEISYYKNLINIDGKVIESGKLNCFVLEK